MPVNFLFVTMGIEQVLSHVNAMPRSAATGLRPGNVWSGVSYGIDIELKWLSVTR